MLSTTRVTRRLFCEEGLRLRLRLERSNEKRRACSTWVARKQKGRHVKGMRPVSAVDKDISQSEALELAKTFARRHLLIGSGAGLQYHDPTKAIQDTLTHLQGNEDPVLFIFGGDTADAENPDLGYLVQEVKARSSFACKVLSVQSWKEVDPFVDYVFNYEREFSKDGKEYWGGLVNGKPVAATRFYLSKEMQQLLTSVICIGGGSISRQELSFAIQSGVKHEYIRAEVRNKREGSNPYGPTDDWYQAHHVEKN